MLVLSRRKEETVVFPELGISVEVIRVDGNKVRLGIKAPESVRILRGELEQTVVDFEMPCYVETEQQLSMVPQAA